MNDLESIFRLLRKEGVKSLHIEFQTESGLSSTLETIERRDEPILPAKTVTAKHDMPVHRGEPTAPETVAAPVQEVKEKPVLPVTPVPSAAEIVKAQAAVEKPAETKKSEPAKKAEKAAAAEKQPEAPKVESTKAEPTGKTSDEPIWVELSKIVNKDRNKEIQLRQARFAQTGKKAYPIFCSINAKDDGTITNAYRTAMIDVLGKDELILLNNEFELRVDMDVPDNGRESIILFFQ